MLDARGGGFTAEEYKLAIDRLMGIAAHARTDLPTFHQFVMRDEATQQRITTQLFQRLIFEFIELFPRCILMMPPGTSKTNCVLSRTMWRIGCDHLRRCMWFSKEDEKAVKAVTTAKVLIEVSSELRLVFPDLKPTERSAEPWTQGAIVVDRPAGIKDPTLCAAGERMGVAGFRLSDLIVDDVLDQNNTRTKEARDKTWRQHEDVLLHRLDQAPGRREDTRMVVMNTAWDNDDYLHRLMDSDPDRYGDGWPALLIDIFGNVAIRNVPPEQWNPKALRPAKSNQDANKCAINPEGPFRIGPSDDAYAAATGDDPDCAPLWWPRFTRDSIAQVQKRMTLVGFNQAYRLLCRSEETAKCKMEWIDRCIENGRRGVLSEGGGTLYPPHTSMVAASRENRYASRNPIVMGVDLAFGVGDAHDSNSLSTWEFLPTGHMRLLDIVTMQCANSTFMRDFVIEKASGYENCQIVVETVGAQKMMKDLLLEKDKGLRIRAFNTSGTGSGLTNKWEQTTGVEGMFILISNGAWILPCQPGQRVHDEVQNLINACVYFLPSAHTPDELMATWFAITWGRQLYQWAQAEKGAGGGSLLGLMSR